MRIQRLHRSHASEARGVTIVIDVIRAFSVAAYAFAGGASSVWLVRAVEEAFTLRAQRPDALLAGEVGGRLIAGFDYNNSPAAMARADVRGRLVIQRTGAGTQGAVDAAQASRLLCCGLVNARATAAYAHALAERDASPITLMSTAAQREENDIPAIEDDICSDYLEALLRTRADAAETLAVGLSRLRATGRLSVFAQGWPDFPPDDVPAFLAADRFAFAMEGTRQRTHDVEYVSLRRVEPTGG